MPYPVWSTHRGKLRFRWNSRVSSKSGRPPQYCGVCDYARKACPEERQYNASSPQEQRLSRFSCVRSIVAPGRLCADTRSWATVPVTRFTPPSGRTSAAMQAAPRQFAAARRSNLSRSFDRLSGDRLKFSFFSGDRGAMKSPSLVFGSFLRHQVGVSGSERGRPSRVVRLRARRHASGQVRGAENRRRDCPRRESRQSEPRRHQSCETVMRSRARLRKIRFVGSRRARSSTQPETTPRLY